MRTAHCGITPEGWPCIGLTGFSALVFAALGWWPLALVFLALCWFSMHFFRDPERVTPQGPGLAISPADGKVIRIMIPPLTEDRRKDLVKVARKYTEDAKVAVRNVRRDANDDLKKAEKATEISQDEQKKLETDVQKETDAAIKRIDEALKTKEQEIMQV